MPNLFILSWKQILSPQYRDPRDICLGLLCRVCRLAKTVNPQFRVATFRACEYATAAAMQLQLRAAVCVRVHWQVAKCGGSSNNRNKVTIGRAVKNSRKQLNLVTKKGERKTLRIRNE